jgi:hypothetical protein
MIIWQCKQVTDSLNIAIKFFEMESSTIESDMAKLFYFKGLVKKNFRLNGQNKYHWMTFSCIDTILFLCREKGNNGI